MLDAIAAIAELAAMANPITENASIELKRLTILLGAVSNPTNVV